MNYGLALAGGGTRGAAHAGVLLALKEEGLLPESIGGTSAGSIAAGCFASGMEPEELCEVVRYLSDYGPEYLDPDLGGMLRLVPQLITYHKVCLKGLLKGKKLNRYLCSITQRKNLENLSFPLLIPTVDINSGETICYSNIRQKTRSPVRFIDKGRLCDIMMASSSVPGVFRPMDLDGFSFVDGGVTNNLPVDLMITAGIKHIVAVDIGAGYNIPEYDNIFEVVSHSFSIMSNSLKDCRSSGEILLLKPEITKKAGLFTFEYMEECMEDAYRYTKKEAPKIRKTVERAVQRA